SLHYILCGCPGGLRRQTRYTLYVLYIYIYYKHYIYIYIYIIHLSTPLRRLTTMSFHLFLSSAALFTLPYVPKSDQSHISFIHILIGQPTFFFPSNLPSSLCRCDKPLEPLRTCPAYSNFLVTISFVKCNSVRY